MIDNTKTRLLLDLVLVLLRPIGCHEALKLILNVLVYMLIGRLLLLAARVVAIFFVDGPGAAIGLGLVVIRSLTILVVVICGWRI